MLLHTSELSGHDAGYHLLNPNSLTCVHIYIYIHTTLNIFCFLHAFNVILSCSRTSFSVYLYFMLSSCASVSMAKAVLYQGRHWALDVEQCLMLWNLACSLTSRCISLSFTHMSELKWWDSETQHESNVLTDHCFYLRGIPNSSTASAQHCLSHGHSYCSWDGRTWLQSKFYASPQQDCCRTCANNNQYVLAWPSGSCCSRVH